MNKQINRCTNCDSENVEIDYSVPVMDMTPPIYTYKCNDCNERF